MAKYETPAAFDRALKKLVGCCVVVLEVLVGAMLPSLRRWRQA